jgi:hypothetical protein
MKKILFVSMMAFAVWGCQKSMNEPTEPVINAADSTAVSISAENEAEADNIFDGVFDNVIGVNEECGIGTGIGVFGKKFINGKEDSTSGKCFTVTISPNIKDSFPKTVTIDFGAGCQGPDGHIRKGKIVTVYTGPLSIPGKKSSTTFVDFFIDGVQVKGTFYVQNSSTSNQRSFTTELVGGKLIYSTTHYTEYAFNKTVLQTEGNGSPNYPLDDVYKITGKSRATLIYNNTNNKWTAEISEPIIKKYTCKWIGKGIVTVTYNGLVVTKLNYGNGDCDNKATLTINGQTVNITLK